MKAQVNILEKEKKTKISFGHFPVLLDEQERNKTFVKYCVHVQIKLSSVCDSNVFNARM